MAASAAGVVVGGVIPPLYHQTMPDVTTSKSNTCSAMNPRRPDWKPTATLLVRLFLASTGAIAADGRAKNVILFLGDAGGLPTLNAAGIRAHDKPQSLFIQGMPHIALADTSALDTWVTDSAAGMTAIMTGRKTNDGMLSLLPSNGEEGPPLKTLLEYAEEHGLATGVVTNMQIWGATPAACYAHATSRESMVEIFTQVFNPRFGDGVDVLIGKDRRKLFEAMEKGGQNVTAALQKAGYRFFESPSALTPDAPRAVSIYDGDDFTPAPVIDTVLQIFSGNPRGYFLMVEWDMHTEKMNQGLDRVIVLDDLIRHVAGKVSPDTLIIFAADHSFDLRVQAGRKGKPFVEQIAATPADAPPPYKPVVRMSNTHTGEEILVAAQGPGAEQLHGFIPNTRIFEVMMAAYGWRESP